MLTNDHGRRIKTLRKGKGNLLTEVVDPHPISSSHLNKHDRNNSCWEEEYLPTKTMETCKVPCVKMSRSGTGLFPSMSPTSPFDDSSYFSQEWSSKTVSMAYWMCLAKRIRFCQASYRWFMHKWYARPSLTAMCSVGKSVFQRKVWCGITCVRQLQYLSISVAWTSRESFGQWYRMQLTWPTGYKHEEPTSRSKFS